MDKVSMTPSASEFVRIATWLFTILISVTSATSLLSFFSSVNTTIAIAGSWLYLYLSVVAVLLVSMLVSLVGNKVQFSKQGGVLKNAFVGVAGLFGFLVLMAFSVFSGVPTVLHHLSSSQGELVVTVSDKQDTYNKRKCSPRLVIEEFTFFSSDYICVDKLVYEDISVGEKIAASGLLSDYGIEPKQIRRLNKQ